MGYICLECRKNYETPTYNFICTAMDCPGEGKTGLLIEESFFEDHDTSTESKSKDNSDVAINLTENSKATINITIGRSPKNDISIIDNTVSSEHAMIIIEESGRIRIKDLGSLNGTFINGMAIHDSVLLKTDLVTIASIPVDWLSYLEQSIEIKDISNTVSIGRSSANDVVVPKEDVSSLHATLIRTHNGKVFIKDEKSRNGTYVNGRKVKQKQLYPKDKILLANKYHVNWRDMI